VQAQICTFQQNTLRSRSSGLNVQVNMIEPNNGQALSPKDNRLLAPKNTQARYTGEIILRTRPAVYRRIVALLAENTPACRIAQICRVSEYSVTAIARREASEITERKKSLAALMSNIAEVGGANVERKIGKAGVRDAIIGTGIAIDKMLALTGQTPATVQVAVVNMPTPEERAERNRTHRALDEVTRLLHQEEPLSPKDELMLKVQLERLRLASPQKEPGELPSVTPSQD
jgi:hypothetical protein